MKEETAREITRKKYARAAAQNTAEAMVFGNMVLVVTVLYS